jgi:hypothetical protein
MASACFKRQRKENIASDNPPRNNQRMLSLDFWEKERHGESNETVKGNFSPQHNTRAYGVFVHIVNEKITSIPWIQSIFQPFNDCM